MALQKYLDQEKQTWKVKAVAHSNTSKIITTDLARNPKLFLLISSFYFVKTLSIKTKGRGSN